MVAGCPLGSSDFVQDEISAAADKVVQLIKRVLALLLSALDKLLLLRKSTRSPLLRKCTRSQVEAWIMLCLSVSSKRAGNGVWQGSGW